MLSLMHPSKLFYFLLHSNLRKEITLVLILKILALFAIWYLFFSQQENISPQQMAEHLKISEG